MEFLHQDFLKQVDHNFQGVWYEDFVQTNNNNKFDSYIFFTSTFWAG